MAAENELTITELPTLTTMDMDEAQVLYDYTGLALQDFVRTETESQEEHEERLQAMQKNPGFVRALVHIAYQREHPALKPDKVKAFLGKYNVIDVYQAVAATEPDEDDAGPPESTPEPVESSPSDSGTSSESSGDSSPITSDEPGSLLEATGTTRSDTSSPPSDLSTLVH